MNASPVVLLSGGSRGLGLKTIRALLGHDFTVVTLSRQRTPEVERLVEEQPGRLLHLTGNIARWDDLPPLVARVEKEVGPIEALIIGLVAGILCQEGVNLVRNRLKIDDTLDVFAVHGIGGIFGTLMIALFATLGFENDATWAAQLGALAVVGLFTVVGTYILVKLCGAIIGFRVDAETETNGLDLSQHGERAYDHVS